MPQTFITNNLDSRVTRVFISNLKSRVTGRHLEDEFNAFGVIQSLWVAWKPPGFAFIDFGNRSEALNAVLGLNGKNGWKVELDMDDYRGALNAVRELDGKNGWKVKLSHQPEGGGGGRGRGRGGGGGRGGRGRSGGGGFDMNCYECGDPGHFARDCRNRGGSRRNQSRTPPRCRRSPIYRRSPRARSRRRRSVSPRRRSYSRSSSPYHGREDVKHANGNGLRDRRRSGS